MHGFDHLTRDLVEPQKPGYFHDEVLIDLDGVVADFTSACLFIANQYAGTNYTPADVTEWEIFNLPGLREVEDRTWKTISEPGFARMLAVYPGAREGVEWLKSKGPVRILTSPVISPTFMFDRVRWVEKELGIGWKHIIYTYSKELVTGRGLIDDKPENILAWTDRNTGPAVLWAQPYNQAAWDSDAFDRRRWNGRIVRTNVWAEAYDHIYNNSL